MAEWIQDYKRYLELEEKSTATIEKYLRDCRAFFSYLGKRKITKEVTIGYKEYLVGRYAVSSINSMLTALNGFLRFIGKGHCCVKLMKVQRQMFCREERELTQEEYKRLVKAAEGTRMALVLQTICGTGIRVSELQYITVAAVEAGKAVVQCKNKTRVIFIPKTTQGLLKRYIRKAGVTRGSVFTTKGGKPLNRSNIWREMKALCTRARVNPRKVFPHNLRHLFARTFYSLERDIVRLADLLGHSSINTTRIYTVEDGRDHRARLERVQMLLTT